MELVETVLALLGLLVGALTALCAHGRYENLSPFVKRSVSVIIFLIVFGCVWVFTEQFIGSYMRAPDNNGEPVKEASVDVLAAKRITNTGIMVISGQRIDIKASGEVFLDYNLVSAPKGISPYGINKPLPNSPTGCLYAVIGRNNSDFIPIGNGKKFYAARDGHLFLGVNDGYFQDNRGSYKVLVSIFQR
jgi:hypothetical protein